jgi:hypothetical protein
VSVQHSAITDPNIHEPKGVASAASGAIYVADGAGSGAWYSPTQYAALITPELDIPVPFPYGGVYFTAPSVTTISVSGTYVKAAGTTSPTNLLQFDTNSVSNRLRYIGTSMRHFHIVLQASITFSSGTNQVGGLQLYYYDDSEASGVLVPHTEAKSIVASTAVTQITSHGDLMLSENDYIEIWVANHSGTNDIQVDLGYMFLVGMGG